MSKSKKKQALINANLRECQKILDNERERLERHHLSAHSIMEWLRGGNRYYDSWANMPWYTREILEEMPVEIVQTDNIRYSRPNYDVYNYRARIFDTQEETNAWKYKRLEKRLELLMRRGIVLPEDEKEAVEIDREMEKLRGGAIPHV